MTTPAHRGHVEVDGRPIYHEVHGEGRPLVLLHGAGACRAGPTTSCAR